MRTDKVITQDGTVMVYSIGSGPGIVILHGGAVAERDYRRLAQAFSNQFTVHLYNRRGRADSRPLDGTETVDTDMGDLSAVLEHTGARSIFGHSGGGFVALQAGLRLSLDRIAVYDPGLSILGRPSFEWFDEFEKLVQSGDDARAMTIMARAVHPEDPGSKLPFGLALAVTRGFNHTPIGRRLVELMPTAPPEIRRIHDHDGPASDYAVITADVLLAAGARSSTYFTENCEAVAAAIPHGRAIVIPGASHNAANVARKSFVEPFASFFAGSLTIN